MPDHSDFVAGLRAEREAFHGLCKLLEGEQACLVGSDIEGLLEVTTLKSQNVDLLVELGRRRTHHLESVGLSAGQAGMADWLAGHAGAQRGELTQVWRELVGFAADARALNDLNGKLITTRYAHNQAALAALHASIRTQSVYGPDGQAALLTGQRDLGQA